MTQRVLLRIDGGVATLSLNRPDVMNAMDGEMMIQLRAASELVARDPAIRVVVLRGEGPAFCAGGDVALFGQRLDDLPQLVLQMGREFHFALWALRRAPKPVLGVVHGTVAGAGFSLLCATDLAIAADDTRFTLAYTNIGTSPDGGSSHFLPRLVGYKRAMQLTLLPDMFDAAAARDYGLVNWTVPAAALAAEAAKIAGRLAKGPTVAYGEAKGLMNASLGRSMEAQMEEELFAFGRCAATADLREGVTAFVEKRKPAFRGA
ncbi:MAG: enoyl-CoA hydratase/isomerase family protein [Burkholderiales bacterium]|nr:enoyl-CoA hydratase/isomerase family protein [Burkholderiales bacterium]